MCKILVIFNQELLNSLQAELKLTGTSGMWLSPLLTSLLRNLCQNILQSLVRTCMPNPLKSQIKGLNLLAFSHTQEEGNGLQKVSHGLYK